jgi:hypothetical protein
MIPDLRRFLTPDLRRFMIQDLRGFMTPDVRRFMIQVLCRFMIFVKLTVDSHEEARNGYYFHILLQKLISQTLSNPTFRGCKVFY